MKTSRLFEIIQLLRQSRKPVTALQLSSQLEVSVRSIYSDMASLQAMCVPISGDRGVGYILRPGYDLPPLMFSPEEIEAITLGMALIKRTGDGHLVTASNQVISKIATIVPSELSGQFFTQTLQDWGTVIPSPGAMSFAQARAAIREEQKIELTYQDQQGQTTVRIVWPLALIYYTETALLVSWCELRQAIRHFRLDRIEKALTLEQFFKNSGQIKRRLWLEHDQAEAKRD